MAERLITVETRLKPNTDLTNYLNSAVIVYEQAKREIWHQMTNPNYNTKYSKESDFTKDCRKKYDLHSRIINSIIHEVKGLMNAYIELKKTELNTVEQKIIKQEKKITKTKDILDKLKNDVTYNKATEKQLIKYRKNKRTIFNQKRRLNRLKVRKANLEFIIEHNVYKVCFGTKHMLKKQYNLDKNDYKTHIKWHNDFNKCRDKNIYFLGSANETCGNSMVNFVFDSETNLFDITIRKIEKLKGNKRGSDDNYVLYKGLNFNYRKDDLLQLLNQHIIKSNKRQPITYRFHRRGTTWYLQIIYTKKFENTSYLTRSNNGVIGLDYNDGFIQLAETDTYGNLIHLQKYNLKYHGCGNKAKTEIEQTISIIVKYAISVGKDIAIENLDFRKTKAKQTKAKSNKGKDYNRMLHLFDYNRYNQKLKDIAFNNKVYLAFVNPKNTSKIGKQKYSDKMKLTVHQSASYVIARRYQGFKDNLKVTKS